MIHPSYSELIEAINTYTEDNDDTMLLNSRYSLVLATSKRARQLIAGAEPLVENAAGKKPLSIAIDELYHGKAKILPGEVEEEEDKRFDSTPLFAGESIDEMAQAREEGKEDSREENSEKEDSEEEASLEEDAQEENSQESPSEE